MTDTSSDWLVAAPARYPHVARLGVAGVLVRFTDRLDDAGNRAALAFAAALEASDIAGRIETALTLGSVFLRLDPAAADPVRVAADCEDLLARRDWFAADLPPGRRRWTIPACFDGPCAAQLSEVADLSGTDADAAAATLGDTALRVLALGFAPGQPYLGLLPEAWDIPRQSGLTKRIPEGALAVAVRQVVLFSAPTPTGWRQVGQTAFRCFRPDSDVPVPLRSGDEIRFARVTQDDLADIRARDASGDGGATAEAIS